jgi:hypothetical protein
LGDGANQTNLKANHRCDVPCSGTGLFLPVGGEEDWPKWVQIIVWFLLMAYFFLGVALLADAFMVGAFTSFRAVMPCGAGGGGVCARARTRTRCCPVMLAQTLAFR